MTRLKAYLWILKIPTGTEIIAMYQGAKVIAHRLNKMESTYSMGRNCIEFEMRRTYLFEIIAQFHRLQHSGLKVIMRDEQEETHEEIDKADDEVENPGYQNYAGAPELAFNQDY